MVTVTAQELLEVAIDLHQLTTLQGEYLSSGAPNSLNSAREVWKSMKQKIKSIPDSERKDSFFYPIRAIIESMSGKRNRAALLNLNWELQSLLAGAKRQIKEDLELRTSLDWNPVVRMSGLTPTYAMNAEITLGKNRYSEPI